MELINVGLARTGTTSLKAALERLGIAPVHHAVDLFTHPKHMDIWEGAFAGQPVDWRAFYASYEAADWPAGFFYRDIIDAHPDAKVMVTMRDPAGWYESLNSIYRQGLAINLPIPHVRRVQQFIVDYGANEFFEGKLDDREHMMRFFEDYVAGVRAFVPADRLLVYSVREGWEPLCAFLEAEVPDEPFPHVNTRGGFRAVVMRALGRMKE